jgi:hypothetical protein
MADSRDQYPWQAFPFSVPSGTDPQQPVIRFAFRRDYERWYERCAGGPREVLASLVKEAVSCTVAMEEAGEAPDEGLPPPFDELLSLLRSTARDVHYYRRHFREGHQYNRPPEYEACSCMVCGRSGDI